MTTRSCACDVPSEANLFLEVVYEDANGETDYSYAYRCSAHRSKPSEIIPDGSKVLEWKRRKIR